MTIIFISIIVLALIFTPFILIGKLSGIFNNTNRERLANLKEKEYIKKIENSFIAGNKEAVSKYLDEYARFIFANRNLDLKNQRQHYDNIEKIKRTYLSYNMPIPEHIQNIK